MEIMRRAQEQKPSPDGIRRTRWAVIRNTYRELQDTTCKTWLGWFDEDYFGRFNWGDMAHRISTGDIEIEVLFRALDRPQDVKKLLSMELTGAWVNEAREVPKSIIDGLSDRVERYPGMRDGGPTWAGVMADTNPPDVDHWWYRLAEIDRPTGWEFFRQPGGLVKQKDQFVANPHAENLSNLPGGHEYYLKRMAGKKDDHIQVYYCSEYGFVIDGKPIYSEYVDSLHCTKEVLQPIKGLKVYIGIDFGLTPAAVFAQKLPNGRWIWLDELVSEDMGISRFADLLKPKMLSEYRGHEFEIWGDPAGDIRAQTDETTPFQILQAKGIPAQPAPTNDFIQRRESVSTALSRIVDGKPGLLISPKCEVTRKGMSGGYCFKRVQVAGDEKFHDKPDKNKFSHVCEAGQYLMIGAGEGEALISGSIPKVKIPTAPIIRMNFGAGAGSGWMGA